MFVPDSADVSQEQRKLSTVVKNSVNQKNERYGPSIFPDETATLSGQVNHNTLNASAGVYRFESYITGYVIGCVDYELALGGRGQTRVCWIISQTSPSGHGIYKRGYAVPNVIGTADGGVTLTKAWPGSDAE